MGKYRVTITETLELAINVVAENQSEAERTARDNWKEGVYILDAGNFTGVVFEAAPMDKPLGITT